MAWMYLTLAIFSEVAATSALKASEEFTRFWPSLLVVVGYGLALPFTHKCRTRTHQMGQAKAQSAAHGGSMGKLCNAGMAHLVCTLRVSHQAVIRCVAFFCRSAAMPAKMRLAANSLMAYGCDICGQRAGLAFWLMTLCLRTIPLAITYAIWSGAGITLTRMSSNPHAKIKPSHGCCARYHARCFMLITLVGWWWYGQRLDLPGILGMALMISGVLVIRLFSEQAT